MSIQLFVMDQFLRLMVKRRFAKSPDVLTLRAVMADMAATAKPPAPPVTAETMQMGGVVCQILRAPGCDESKAILYLHGGGFVGGAPANYIPLTARLAMQCRVPVYVADYRLAPEHPFPAGLDDAVAAYRALLEKQIKPGHIAIMGDSAGGNLTLAAALKLKSLGLAQPACLVCLSPVTDMAAEPPSRRANVKSDAMFVAATFATVPAHYCPGQSLTDPLISPMRGDVEGLPPTLFQCSASEMLRDDAVLMADKMRAAGIEVDLDIVSGVPHVWQVLADLLPEARTAIAGIAAFINKRLA